MITHWFCILILVFGYFLCSFSFSNHRRVCRILDHRRPAAVQNIQDVNRKFEFNHKLSNNRKIEFINNFENIDLSIRFGVFSRLSDHHSRPLSPNRRLLYLSSRLLSHKSTKIRYYMIRAAQNNFFFKNRSNSRRVMFI